MPEPIALVSLNHVARRTKHLATATAFYRDVLGMKVVARPPFSFDGAWLCGGGIQIHLIANDHFEPDTAIDTQTNHVAFAVSDIDAVERHFQDLGITYVRKLMPQWNVPQIYVQDPDGHLIEFGMYRPIDYMG